MTTNKFNNNAAREEGQILIAERTNTRDGLCYVLQLNAEGIPQCPHCGKAMMRMGDQFENSFCACWWAGSDRGDYYGQVVVAATAEGERAYRDAQAEQARELAAKRAEAAKMAEARRAALAGKKALTKLYFVADDFGTVKPKYLPEAVEVVIEKCYVKDFSGFNGGAAEVMDVIYPDGRRFFIRASQIESIVD